MLNLAQAKAAEVERKQLRHLLYTEPSVPQVRYKYICVLIKSLSTFCSSPEDLCLRTEYVGCDLATSRPHHMHDCVTSMPLHFMQVSSIPYQF